MKFINLPQKAYIYQSFNPKSSFNNIGLLALSTGVGFFLHDQTRKACYALYADAGCSFEAVHTSLVPFLKQSEPKNLRAFLIGGYKDAPLRMIPRLQEFLGQHKIPLDREHLYTTNAPKLAKPLDIRIEDLIEYVGFDLNIGKPIVMRKVPAGESIEKGIKSPWEYEFATNTARYLANNIEMFCTDLLPKLNMQNTNAGALFDRIVGLNNATPLIPLNNITGEVTGSYELLHDSLQAENDIPDVGKFYCVLNTSMLSPTVLLPGKDKTILQLACEKLSEKPDNIHYKIVLFLLMARIRKSEDNQLQGLELLHGSAFKVMLVSLLSNLASCDLLENQELATKTSLLCQSFAAQLMCSYYAIAVKSKEQHIQDLERATIEYGNAINSIFTLAVKQQPHIAFSLAAKSLDNNVPADEPTIKENADKMAASEEEELEDVTEVITNASIRSKNPKPSKS